MCWDAREKRRQCQRGVEQARCAVGVRKSRPQWFREGRWVSAAQVQATPGRGRVEEAGPRAWDTEESQHVQRDRQRADSWHGEGEGGRRGKWCSSSVRDTKKVGTRRMDQPQAGRGERAGGQMLGWFAAQAVVAIHPARATRQRLSPASLGPVLRCTAGRVEAATSLMQTVVPLNRALCDPRPKTRHRRRRSEIVVGRSYR